MEVLKCIECGDELLIERVELGYRYCTKPECQAAHYRGLKITTVGVNKSADSIIVADEDEIARRGEAGEFGKKDTTLGTNYRELRRSAPRRPTQSRVPAARVPAPGAPGNRRPWTEQQEKIVRLYNGMGLSPGEIVERARMNVPRLGITESLVNKIMSTPPLR
jgi:hypothetical protein